MDLKFKIKDFCVNLNDNNKFKQGIYKIYHLSNLDKIYIGSAAGISKYGGFSNRIRRHYFDLLNNKHCNIKLQNFVNKYGIKDLRFEIIEICNPENCISREQYYIDNLNPWFNIALIAGNTSGVKPTLKNLLLKSKPVLQYDLNGNFISEFINTSFASEYTGVSHCLIRQCCYQTAKSLISKAGDFQWQFKISDDYPLKIQEYRNISKMKLLCYDCNGIFIKEYDSILDASNELNIPCGNISKHLANKTKCCYNYIFKKYSKNYNLNINKYERKHKSQIKVTILNIETNEIIVANSLRSIPIKIINRCTITKKIKLNELEFIFKDKYKIKVEK